MKKSGITFDELRELLCELGFRESVVKRPVPLKPILRFSHPVTGTVLLFRRYRPKEFVRARDMLVVRRQLVDNGLIEESALERFLQKATA